MEANMADDTTPLLAAHDHDHGHSHSHSHDHGLARAEMDHPIFYRACHSPCFPQDVLTWIRGILVVYLLAASVMILDFKIEYEQSDYSIWRIFFDFSMASWFLVLIYHLVVFCWCFTHLRYPYIGDDEGGWEMLFLRCIQIPVRVDSLRKQFYFAFFYLLSHAWAFANTAEYFIEKLLDNQSASSSHGSFPVNGTGFAPRYGQVMAGAFFGNDTWSSPPLDETFGGEWFTSFCYVNLFIVATAICLLEIFMLNSIKVPTEPMYHQIGLVVSTGAYLGWAALGSVWTRYFAFSWMVEENVGGRLWAVLQSLGFILIATIMSWVMMFFIAFRMLADGTVRRDNEMEQREDTVTYVEDGEEEEFERGQV